MLFLSLSPLFFSPRSLLSLFLCASDFFFVFTIPIHNFWDFLYSLCAPWSLACNAYSVHDSGFPASFSLVASSCRDTIYSLIQPIKLLSLSLLSASGINNGASEHRNGSSVVACCQSLSYHTTKTSQATNRPIGCFPLCCYYMTTV